MIDPRVDEVARSEGDEEAVFKDRRREAPSRRHATEKGEQVERARAVPWNLRSKLLPGPQTDLLRVLPTTLRWSKPRKPWPRHMKVTFRASTLHNLTKIELVQSHGIRRAGSKAIFEGQVIWNQALKPTQVN